MKAHGDRGWRARRIAGWRGLVLLCLVGGASVLAACDFFVDYTVINQTDEDLLTFGLYAPCDATQKYRDDYMGPERVPARGSYRYDGVTGDDVKCAQVTTLDRRLVLSAKPGLGSVYVIREPLNASNTPEPEPGSLPRRSRWQEFRGSPPIVKLGVGFVAFAFLTAIAGEVRDRIFRRRPA
jgi:hypothetical protein